jgi:hypothetical protein
MQTASQYGHPAVPGLLHRRLKALGFRWVEVPQYWSHKGSLYLRARVKWSLHTDWVEKTELVGHMSALHGDLKAEQCSLVAADILESLTEYVMKNINHV